MPCPTWIPVVDNPLHAHPDINFPSYSRTTRCARSRCFLPQSRIWVCPPRIRIGVVGCTVRMALKTEGPERIAPIHVMRLKHHESHSCPLPRAYGFNRQRSVTGQDEDATGTHPTRRKKSGSSLIASANWRDVGVSP